MTTLVLTSRRIENRYDGYDLRVAQLCARIPGERRLIVVPLTRQRDATAVTIDASRIFSDVQQGPPLLDGPQRRRRHLRRSNRHFLAKTVPATYTATRARLRAVLAAQRITRVVAFGDYLAELVAGLAPVPVLLDVCDSNSLTKHRALERSGGMRRLSNWPDFVDLYRVQRTEAWFPDVMDYVTTVSEPDSVAIRGLHAGPTGNVLTVPNGVDEAFLAPLPEPGTRRGVVFWGNLAFRPNHDALAFFVQRHFPLLREAGVQLRVIGTGAPGWLSDLAEREPLVSLAGFVPDLRTAVTPYPLMINPMCSGSGLKNKVLEAFGLGVAVVSTPLGVEAFPTVHDGEHVVLASEDGFGSAVLELLDDPQRRQVLRTNAHRLLHEQYRWAEVCRVWDELFAEDRAAAEHG